MSNTTNLDGKLVRVIDDIYCDGELIAGAGTVFRWDDSSTDQNIDGVLVWIGEDEVEEVKC